MAAASSSAGAEAPPTYSSLGPGGQFWRTLGAPVPLPSVRAMGDAAEDPTDDGVSGSLGDVDSDDDSGDDDAQRPPDLVCVEVHASLGEGVAAATTALDRMTGSIKNI